MRVKDTKENQFEADIFYIKVDKTIFEIRETLDKIKGIYIKKSSWDSTDSITIYPVNNSNLIIK